MYHVTQVSFIALSLSTRQLLRIARRQANYSAKKFGTLNSQSLFSKVNKLCIIFYLFLLTCYKK